ncbi:flagellar protein FlaG [Virgibacillus soli]|uniref:Flagellar protein FlaG n=1 Tax=Paracerasibacillus soli TaxID=480284 RepID=A0ABU5CRC4_9BACI|nr:flagellar protein FlaG [Virgibacillus soli]MDY0408913.1 flagellar protein FlaG [Virgibacillus soli]
MRIEHLTGTSSMQQNVQQQDTNVKLEKIVLLDGSTAMKENVEDTIQQTVNISTAVEKMNDFIEPLHTDLKFLLHEKLNEYYVAVVNPITDEIIKEIPPKKMLDMYAEMAQFMGILIDKKI